MPNTTVPAAGEAMPAANFNRRAMLTGTAATAAALAASTLPAEPGASPILALFREWDALYQGGYQTEEDDEELGAICARMRDLENQMAALPALNARDFAAKVIALATFGEYGINQDGVEDLFADARAVLS